ncbi:putative RNA-binding protein [Gregarina niphandrodes]|uniref:RNA-binding protein n=1 Tax=Gregarina niphandrodes TaxID=110365 RepID=A0A023B020_GRENI|nr:putative RNA-binding protein [Gregarina niphandrodes]EZG44799.1 putative RNA-binding protein [Gregarina niphandrodes]|eukprot:XP_011132658.1 putative RNA-binding protein [Gregarina niphandrodes]
MSSAHSQIQKINDLITLQLKDPLGPSFHDSYKDSCYIFVGGLDIRMTEGDVMIVFSQWGEIVDINLIRDRETGEPKGFGFLAYEDQRSTVLAVDNGNGMRLLNRTLKVDHVRNYAVFLKGEGAEQEARTREQSSPENELKNEVKNEVKEERGQELRDKESVQRGHRAIANQHSY